jgi:Icc-related predicted phosphoesterase
MSKVVIISDLHGNLPNINPCDILIIAGDSEPVWSHDIIYQKSWLFLDFRNWLKSLPAKHICLISGNHSIYAQTVNKLDFKLDNVSYLRNSSVSILGLNIWGSPYSPSFGGWPFMLSDDNLDFIYRDIPDNTDIIISHAPCYGILDLCPSFGRSTNEFCNQGSKSLLKHVLRVKPSLFIAGHLHSNYGVEEYNEIKFIAASLVNENYQFCRNPIEIEIAT